VADADPARLEKELERAKKNASGAERLCRIGALAKVEAEQRALKVVRLESDLENARLAGAKEELIAQQGRLLPAKFERRCRKCGISSGASKRSRPGHRGKARTGRA